MKLATRQILKSTVILFGFLFSVVLQGSIAQAASSGGFGGRPAHPDPANPRTQSIFVYTIDRSQAKQDQILVSNNSDKEQTILLHAVDGVVTNTGAYTCRQHAEAAEGIGAWLQLSKDEVTLKPGANELVDFTVTMPANADVGEHNGCITMQSKSDEGVAQGGVRVRTRQAVRVVATVPGDLHRNIEITDFTAKQTTAGQHFDISLKNTGNVSADVDTRVVLKDLFGGQIYENGGSYPVLSDQKLDLNFDNKKELFWGGWYKAQVTIAYDKRAGVLGIEDKANLLTKQSQVVTIFVAPSLKAILLLLLIAGVILGIIAWRVIKKRRRQQEHNRWHSYTVQHGDTIETVAAKHAVSWKKLAAINQLKAPYTLSVNSKIKVPTIKINKTE